MKDFKQNVKMKAEGGHCYKSGGSVKKYNDGGSVANRLSEIQEESRRYEKEGIPEKPTARQMPAVTMTRIAEHFKNPRKIATARAEENKKRSAGGMDAEELQRELGPDVKVGYKRGGKTKRGKK